MSVDRRRKLTDGLTNAPAPPRQSPTRTLYSTNPPLCQLARQILIPLARLHVTNDSLGLGEERLSFTKSPSSVECLPRSSTP